VPHRSRRGAASLLETVVPHHSPLAAANLLETAHRSRLAATKIQDVAHRSLLETGSLLVASLLPPESTWVAPSKLRPCELICGCKPYNQSKSRAKSSKPNPDALA
jgi:hypothetical protein